MSCLLVCLVMCRLIFVYVQYRLTYMYAFIRSALNLCWPSGLNCLILFFLNSWNLLISCMHRHTNRLNRFQAFVLCLRGQGYLLICGSCRFSHNVTFTCIVQNVKNGTSSFLGVQTYKVGFRHFPGPDMGPNISPIPSCKNVFSSFF